MAGRVDLDIRLDLFDPAIFDIYDTSYYRRVEACRLDEERWRLRIFKTKPFARFARKARLNDAALCEAVDSALRGLIDADLGGGVLKQRIARPGGGKSGGFRTIILFRVGAAAFFVHGFAKNEQDDIREDELAAFKMLAAVMLSYDDVTLDDAIGNGTLMEVIYNG